MVWMTIWIVLMLFWLFFGTYISWDPNRPQAMGNTIIPWLCVLLLGLILFGALPHEVVRNVR